MEVTFFYGLAKNAGKTTTLNWYTRRAGDLSRKAFMSIGWDGESFDHLFGHSKPSIELPPNTSIVTFSKFAPAHGEELLDLKVDSPFFGTLKLFRLKRREKVQLVGPNKLGDLKKVIDKLRDFNYGEVIIDGAVDRRIGFEVATRVFIVISPIIVPLRGEDRDYQLLSEIARAYHQILSNSKISQNSQEVTAIPGGVTSDTLESLWRRGVKEILLENPSKLVLEPSELVTWVRRISFRFKQVPKLEAIIWNPFDIERGMYDLKAKAIGEELSKQLPITVLELVNHQLESA